MPFYKNILMCALLLPHSLWASSSQGMPCRNIFKEIPFLSIHSIQLVDPVVFEPTQTAEISSFFSIYGYVVIDNISTTKDRDAVVARIDEIVAAKIPHVRRLGFLDLYHDNSIAQIRQNESLVGAFQNLLHTDRLWSVFDRVLYAETTDSDDPLPPHVDQNPLKQSGFANLQGILALRDMNEDTGTVALVPQSHHFFEEYIAWIKKPSSGHVEYAGERSFTFIAPRLKEGQIVIWDSRTTHSRFAGTSQKTRYGLLVSYTPAVDDSELVALRLNHFTEGTGWSHHEAGLRATSKPRYDKSLRKEDEVLTQLGKKLYGVESWFEND